MAITKGTALGPYEIVAHIGSGGMGDVWRARDKRIGRDVAIKVLPESYAPGDERVRRFEQEARAAGALNHPGLVTIFDVGIVDGAPYIVMELLEGETLRDAIGDIQPKPLSLRKTIDYTMQIASALGVAHEKGIIHRDLKPENIVITAEGRTKILDFGLAKLAQDTSDVDPRSHTARHLTSSGMVVGTPGYMSPEQVRAQPLDYRTDIFSLGAVLYEMLSGRRAFDSDSAVETMHAVLNEEPPPLTSIAPNVPPALDAIVRHCMEKNPRERFQSARDLAFQLRVLPESQRSVTDNLKALPEPPRRTRWAFRGGTVLVAALALAAAGFGILHGRGGRTQPGPQGYRQLTFGDGLALFPTLAPDGKTFAFVSAQSGNRDIYVQRVDGRTPTNITGDSPADDSEPAFSPDGSQIAFRSERDGGGIFVMGVTGESVRRLTDFGHNPAWSPDGTRIVMSTAAVDLRPQAHRVKGELWTVDVRTDVKKRIVKVRPENDALQPSWSPHGTRLAFWGVSATGQRDIWTVAPDAAEPDQTIVRVTSDPAIDWNPGWSPDGHYLYFGSDRNGTQNLWRIAIDESSGVPEGAPEPLSLPSPFSGNFTFSQHGDLLFTAVTRSYRLLAFPFDATSAAIGAPRLLFGRSEEIESFAASPDRQSIAFTTAGMQEDLFIARADGSRLRQITNDAARDRGVTWSPDGKTLYFYSNRGGSYNLWSIRADGSGLGRVTDSADLVRNGAHAIYSPVMSPDQRTLVAETDRADGSAVLVHLDRPFAGRVELLAGVTDAPDWSPDGRQIVYAAKDGISIYSLQTHSSRVIAGPGTAPRWLADGTHVAFVDGTNIGVVDLETGKVTTAALATSPGARLGPTRISRDGTTSYTLETVEQGDIWIAYF